MNSSHFFRRAIASLVAFAATSAVLLPVSAQAQDNNFLDVSPSDPNASYIADLKTQGILHGYGDGRFGPNDPITREQFATLFVNALHLPAGTGSMPFTDSTGWSASYIKTAYEYHIVNGTSPQTFSPAQTIKREEAAQMVWNYMKMIGISAPSDAQNGSAAADADLWAQASVRNVTALGLRAQGAEDSSSYDSQAVMLRGDAATLIDLALKKIQQRQAAMRPDHVVVVVEENHSSSEVIGNSSAPYINSLAAQGAYFNHAHGVEHPSQPNYLDLFSGSNQGIQDDSVPHTFTAPNLASELLNGHQTFDGYSEDMPSMGFTGNWSNQYGRKHNPWVDFTNVPSSVNLPFSHFPSDFSTLPTVSFVIPNMNHDMHDGTVAQGDTWLHDHLDSYVQWAKTHNSLLIVTWDEDDFTTSNIIPTLFVGPMVKQGTYSETINHLNVLRTLEDLYGLPHVGNSGTVAPIYDVWK